MLKKIQQVGLDAEFKNPKLAATLFIPTNEAFAKVLKALGASAAASNATVVKDALNYHMLTKWVPPRGFWGGGCGPKDRRGRRSGPPAAALAGWPARTDATE